MKLRIFGKSVRLRLSRGEVARVADGETIEERTPFAPLPLVYRLANGDVSSTHFADGVLTIRFTRRALRTWADGSDVGLSHESAGVRVLIEKDFACLHGDADEQLDTFPNPLADASTGIPRQD